jgi:DNA-binding transcriptional MerR regulator
MYDAYSADAILLIIRGLKEKGYAFKTVSELLQSEGK